MKAFIVSSRPHREADAVLRIVTRQRGKETVRAPGLRWAKGKLKSHLQPLRWVELQTAAGRYRNVVVGAEELNGHGGTSAEALAGLVLVGRVIDTIILEETPQPQIFSYLQRAVSVIRDRSSPHPFSVALFWSLRMMGKEGYTLAPTTCVSCGDAFTDEESVVAWSPHQQGFVCASCRPEDRDAVMGSSEAFRVLRFLVAAGEEHARRLRLEHGLRRELGGLVTTVLRSLPVS